MSLRPWTTTGDHVIFGILVAALLPFKNLLYWCCEYGRDDCGHKLIGEMDMNITQIFLAAVITVWTSNSFNQDAQNLVSNSGGEKMALELTSSAFHESDFIPAKYTGDGADVSPPLKWTQPPAETKSLALICDDPDAPMGTWVHWVVYNIPPTTLEFAEAMPKDASLPDDIRQGRTDFGSTGYGGPAPPKGKPHRYYFKLYALNSTIDLKPGATKADLLKAIKGKVIAEASLMGKYQRK
jgi:Raf kinase inhibitor-like YbhB/YbcL family protein